MSDDPYEDYFKPPLGLELSASPYQPRRDVIGEAGQAHVGNSVIRVGRENAPGQGWTQIAYLVLSPAEREMLIERLMSHRTAAPGDSVSGRFNADEIEVLIIAAVNLLNGGPDDLGRPERELVERASQARDEVDGA